jgi:hypothetical protein
MIKKSLLFAVAMGLALAGAAAGLSAQTGLNGTNARPFYVVAHNPNTLDDVDSALAAGANALEPDLQILPAGAVAGIPCNPPPGLCFEDDPDGIVLYHDHVLLTTRIPMTLENFLDGLHQRAKDNPQLAMILFDVKPSVAALPDGPANGKKILDEIRARLNTDGVNLNIIINVGSRDDIHLFDTILPMLGAREGVQVDGEDRADLIVAALRDAANGNIGYGDGTIGPGPNLPRAVDLASYLKASWGFPRVISDVFTIQEEASMNFFIDAGADGIIPDISDVLAPEFTDPSYLTTLKSFVGPPHHPEIRMATREDNPFKPELQAYGLQIRTMDTGTAGTNADLKFKLNGCRGSSELIYNTGMVHDFYSTGRMEADQADWVTIPSLNLGKLTSLEIHNFGGGLGGAPDWDLADLSVASARWIEPRFIQDKAYTATVNATIPADGDAIIDLKPNFTLPLPTIECPAPITVDNAPGKCNAVVNFAPKVEGLCPDVIAVSKPPSGSIFDVGTTNVSSNAHSAEGDSPACLIKVTVKDVEGPKIACPAPMTVDATGPLGVAVTFAPVATDNCSATVSSAPASGSVFAIGTTPVTSTAQDPSGNQSSCNFTVHVKGAAEQLADLITVVTNLTTKPGTKNALLVKLNAALAKVASANNGPVCGPLADFISLVNAQRDKDIAVSDADALIAKATQIRAVVGC